MLKHLNTSLASLESLASLANLASLVSLASLANLANVNNLGYFQKKIIFLNKVIKPTLTEVNKT